MVTDRQKRANKANAQKSTGPRTRQGKARSSRNATQHGLNMPPDQDAMIYWYRIILDDAKAVPDLFSADPKHLAAFRLAETEARRTRAARAEQTHLKQMTDRTVRHRHARYSGSEDAGLSGSAALEAQLAQSGNPQAQEPLELYGPGPTASRGADIKSLKRITRYRREAEARRRKALKTWTET